MFSIRNRGSTFGIFQKQKKRFLIRLYGVAGYYSAMGTTCMIGNSSSGIMSPQALVATLSILAAGRMDVTATKMFSIQVVTKR